MESQDSYSSAGFQGSRQLFHELIQYFKFTVHINTQSLERPLTGLLDGIFFLLFREKIQSLLNDFPQFRRGIDPMSLTYLIGNGPR